MGTWAPTVFGNDTAADWVWACAECDDYRVCEEAFDDALKPDAEDHHGQQAVAAGEALCRALGKATAERSAYCADLVRWQAKLTAKPDVALMLKAVRALNRVLDPEFDCSIGWVHEDSAKAWRQAVLAIRGVLVQASEASDLR